MVQSDRIHQHHLRRAARLALRGHGGAEPNPMVGCIILSPAGETVGWGYHRQIGGPHAEIVALRRAGPRARGATLYCTLEPCNHAGRTGPCSQAIIDAGVARVLVARRDPWPTAAGGIERMRAAGIDAQMVNDCEFARMVSEPFAHRLTTGLPWVTVKWAQTHNGRLAFSPGNARRWISGQASRAMVHRERGRVDSILTGIGTVLADDPLLTPRGIRLRRMHRLKDGLPWRVVIDARLRLPIDSRLVATAEQAPLLVICDQSQVASDAARQLRSRGANLWGFAPRDGELPLADVFKRLVRELDVAHLLVEAGPNLMTRLFRQRLASEAWVFTAQASPDDARAILPFAPGARFAVWSRRTRGGDVIERSLIIAG